MAQQTTTGGNRNLRGPANAPRTGRPPVSSTMRLPMRVWDLPVRLIHWLIVLGMAASYITDDWHLTQAHIWIGEATLGLLLYRLIWGFVGSETAQFREFLRSPLEGFRHLATLRRVEPDNEVGHNAAGGWMVLILLGLIALQVASGLGIQTRSGLAGPLAHYLSPQTQHLARAAHGFLFNLLLAATILHVLAVAGYYLMKRQNLLRPMLTGKKRLPASTRAPRMAGGPRMVAVLLVVAAALAALLSFA